VPRLAARSAGSRARARLAQFSADLLEAELACFATVDHRFAEAVPEVQDWLTAAWDRYDGHPGPDQQLLDDLASALARTLEDCRADVTRLCRIGTDLALESIRDELGHCEQTLPDSFAGIAQAGTHAAEDQTGELTRQALAGYQQTEQPAITGLDLDLRTHLALSSAAQEPLPALLERVTRLAGPALPQLSGRGLWWRPSSSIKGAARHAVIGLTNTVREAAMLGTNAAHAALNS
jgi:hypothetical protein